jgi:dTDP-4-amino-4,6-dideoxy-D-galactose acyltransferase
MTVPDDVVDSPGWVRLAWDSDHFGFAIGRLLSPTFSEVDLTKALHSADTEGIRCLYWLSDPDAAQTALGERAGFKKVDVRVQLGADLRSEPRRVDAVPGIREAVESDLVPLKALASRSHRNTRFYTDRSFERTAADTLYAAWIERSFSDATQTVYVSGPPGEPGGYIAFGVTEEGDGVIGLVAVAPSQRGAGIGSALVSAAMRRLAARGIQRLDVVTQGDNHAAQNLYYGLGFKERNRSIWLHRWFEPRRSMG